MSFLPIYFYFILVSFLVSLTVFTVPKATDRYLRFFPPFLIATLAVEFTGSYLSYSQKNNLTLYNFFTAFEFVFYLWILSLIIQHPKVKKVIWATMFIYAIAAVVNIVYVQKMKTFHTYTYVVGCLIIVIFCIYYFFELFRLPKSVKLKNNPSFWICSGLLFFYCCGFPLFGLINSWGNISPLILRNFDAIVTILNIFLYSLFTIAFLCRIKVRKYTL